MFAVAIDPDELPHMLVLVKSFMLMDAAGLTFTEHIPGDLANMLEYLAEWCAPPPQNEKEARHMVDHWLKAYVMMYGTEVSNLGVDTLQ